MAQASGTERYWQPLRLMRDNVSTTVGKAIGLWDPACRHPSSYFYAHTRSVLAVSNCPTPRQKLCCDRSPMTFSPTHRTHNSVATPQTHTPARSHAMWDSAPSPSPLPSFQPLDQTSGQRQTTRHAAAAWPSLPSIPGQSALPCC